MDEEVSNVLDNDLSDIIKNPKVRANLKRHTDYKARIELNKNRKELIKKYNPKKKRGRPKTWRTVDLNVQGATHKENYVIEPSSEEVKPTKKRRKSKAATARISDKERTEVIVLLQKNDYNYKYVSDITGYNQKDIMLWFNRYQEIMHKEILSPSEIHVMEEVARVNGSSDEKNEVFIQAIVNVKAQILQRISDLVPKERNMVALTKAMEVLANIEKANTAGIIGNIKTSSGTILQNIQNQIVQITKR